MFEESDGALSFSLYLTTLYVSSLNGRKMAIIVLTNSRITVRIFSHSLA